MPEEPLAHLVFLHRGPVLVVKRSEAGWRQLQDEWDNYMASFGPWSAAEICDHFALDYGEDDSRWSFSRLDIERFLSTPEPDMLEFF